jgi:hypothetical protein
MEDQKPETTGPPWFRSGLLLVSFFLFRAWAFACALGLGAAIAFSLALVLAFGGSTAALALARVLALTTVFFDLRLGGAFAAVLVATGLRSCNRAGAGNEP